MAPKYPYALQTTSGQTPNELVNGILGDLIPDLDQGSSSLLDNLCYCPSMALSRSPCITAYLLHALFTQPPCDSTLEELDLIQLQVLANAILLLPNLTD
ncbi:putative helicase mov-10-B.2 [Tachysurus ichikawai]